jgi:hypothetical protein
VFLYGTEGVGKSTFAAGAPSPIFLDAEHGTLGLDVARVRIRGWDDAVAVVAELRGEHEYRTVVLDTVDALDRMLQEQVCRERNARSIEDVGGGYGKGWTAVAEAWASMLHELAELQARKQVNVLLLGHAAVETHRDPDGPEWRRWAPRVSRRSGDVIKGWASEVLFATREVASTKADKGKGRGGARVLLTEWSPGHDAKNRRQLPARLPLDWGAFAAALKRGMKLVRAPEPEPDQAPGPASVEDAPSADAVACDEARSAIFDALDKGAPTGDRTPLELRRDALKATKAGDLVALRGIEEFLRQCAKEVST